MNRKKCHVCGAYSYSASNHGKWTCPSCGEDLTDERAEVANEKKEVSS